MGKLLNMNLLQRVLVAIVGGPAILYTIYAGGILFFAFVLGLVLISIYEMNLFAKKGDIKILPVVIAFFALFCLSDFYKTGGEYFLYIFLSFSIVVFLFATFSFEFKNIGDTAYQFLTFIYAAVFPGTLILIREHSVNTTLNYTGCGLIIIALFLTVWFVDTFAYFAGKSMGKHSFFAKISPKKTWEGAVGGFIGGAVAAFAFRYFFAESIPLLHTGAIVIICGTLGQLGDLVESRLKRMVGIKDSSNILPGHGGILDRFDGLIFVAPVIYMILKFMETL